MTKRWVNIAILLLVAFMLFFFVIKEQSPQEILAKLKSLNLWWLLLAFLFMVMYWLLEALVLQLISSFIQAKQSFMGSFRTTMVGQFFNSVTPFATGGQPAQLGSLINDGIKASKGSSILTVKFIIYQSVLTIYSIFVLILRAGFFKQKIPQFFFLAEIGFIVNSFVIALVLLFALSKSVTKRVLDFTANLLKHLRIIQDADKAKLEYEKGLEKFHRYIKLISSDKVVLFKTAIVTFVQLSAFFLIPYFIYKAFGLSGSSWLDILCANAFVSMVTSFVPLPGGSGGAEGGFYLFFSMFFGKDIISSALLIWRVWTFYSSIIFGGIAVILSRNKTLKPILQKEPY